MLSSELRLEKKELYTSRPQQNRQTWPADVAGRRGRQTWPAKSRLNQSAAAAFAAAVVVAWTASSSLVSRAAAVETPTPLLFVFGVC
jgi:hypothetical protein